VEVVERKYLTLVAIPVPLASSQYG